ncbi:MAG: AAA family ATPase [Patescibacteria group bacterium]
MPTFSNLGIKNYKRLANCQLELRPLAVMIGANGTGKTSFLEAIELLRGAAKGELNARIVATGGLDSLLTFDRAESLELSIQMPIVGHPPIDYRIELSRRGPTYLISAESLSQKRFPERPPFLYMNSAGDNVRYYEKTDAESSGRLVRPTWEHNPFEASLSQVPKMFREPEEFRNKLASVSSFGLMNVGPNSPVRQPQQLRPVTVLSELGDDLISSLYFLRETNRDRFALLQDTLSAAFPDFERLDFPPVAAGMLTLTWKDRKFRHPVYLHQLSEGTLRFLWLAALLLSETLPAVTLIDEPEVSLHPELLGILADLLRAAAQRTQVVVATHSDRLIKFLRPDEVLVLDRQDDGTTKLTWADSPDMDIEKWMKDFTLDEVWEMGRMGGRS